MLDLDLDLSNPELMLRGKLHVVISKQQNKHPEGLFIVAGDFNHTNLKTVLSKFHKNVDIKTRNDKTLDQVYTNIPGAYKADSLIESLLCFSVICWFNSLTVKDSNSLNCIVIPVPKSLA